MKRYIEKDTLSGTIGIDITDDGAYISTHRGRDVEISIPAYIEYGDDKIPITGIGRKAFLSDRYLHEITLPETVKHIGEWAFAGCRSLRAISLCRGTSIDNGTFKDCNALESVRLLDTQTSDRGLTSDTGAADKLSIDTGYLLAAVIRLMNDRFLFDLNEAGSSSWLTNWDRRMMQIINEPDEEGFSALLACGEEDYEGRDNTIEAYLGRRRRRKCRIGMVRLLHDYGLPDEIRTGLTSYLYEHRAGTEHPHTWQVVLNEHGDEEAYYDLMKDCGCITSDNIDIMLSDLGDKHAGMKAYLIRLNSEVSQGGFLDSMDLL